MLSVCVRIGAWSVYGLWLRTSYKSCGSGVIMVSLNHDTQTCVPIVGFWHVAPWPHGHFARIRGPPKQQGAQLYTKKT